MSYRNKTYVAFASEYINYYRLMEAWRDNQNIDFNFMTLTTWPLLSTPVSLRQFGDACASV